jgi:hypothetical protein
MRFTLHAAGSIVIAMVMACAPETFYAEPADSAAGRDKEVWNYDGGVIFATDGSIPEGPCFRISGRLTAPNFFDNLKRINTPDEGAVFRRGNETLSDFPDQLTLAFVLFDLPCPEQMDHTGPRTYLTRSLMSSVHLYMYWKRGVELRAVEGVKPKYFSVDPIIPYAAAKAHDLPQKLEWAYEFEIPSAGVPLTDSLVLILRTADGHMAARVAARL